MSIEEDTTINEAIAALQKVIPPNSILVVVTPSASTGIANFDGCNTEAVAMLYAKLYASIEHSIVRFLKDDNKAHMLPEFTSEILRCKECIDLTEAASGTPFTESSNN